MRRLLLAKCVDFGGLAAAKARGQMLGVWTARSRKDRNREEEQNGLTHLVIRFLFDRAGCVCCGMSNEEPEQQAGASWAIGWGR
jgi:hypothetical protein